MPVSYPEPVGLDQADRPCASIADADECRIEHIERAPVMPLPATGWHGDCQRRDDPLHRRGLDLDDRVIARDAEDFGLLEA